MDKEHARTMMIEQMMQSQDLVYPGLYKMLFMNDIWKNATTVGITMSTKMEIDTQPIIRQAKLENKKIAIPRVISKTQLEFIWLSENTNFKYGKFNILEPINGITAKTSELDTLIVPGLAFSKSNGERLGFGGGYYDRVISNYTGTTISLADGSRVFDVPFWDVDDFDEPVDEILF